MSLAVRGQRGRCCWSMSRAALQDVFSRSLFKSAAKLRRNTVWVIKSESALPSFVSCLFLWINQWTLVPVTALFWGLLGSFYELYHNLHVILRHLIFHYPGEICSWCRAGCFNATCVFANLLQSWFLLGSRFVVQLAEKNVSLLTCSPLKDIETLFCTAALCWKSTDLTALCISLLRQEASAWQTFSHIDFTQQQWLPDLWCSDTAELLVFALH